MNINYTSRKFYKKYIYKLVLNASADRISSSYWGTPAALKVLPRWIEANWPDLDCKITNRYQGTSGNDVKYHQVIYLNDISARDSIMAEFAAKIISVWQPFDQKHADELEIRNVVVPRTSLLFNKYQCAVYFKYDRKAQLHTWLLDYFANSDSARVAGDPWWPRVYLNDDAEIAAIKLTWPDTINYVKRVLLINSRD